MQKGNITNTFVINEEVLTPSPKRPQNPRTQITGGELLCWRNLTGMEAGAIQSIWRQGQGSTARGTMSGLWVTDPYQGDRVCCFSIWATPEGSTGSCHGSKQSRHGLSINQHKSSPATF
jgi:hypothetical protein